MQIADKYSPEQIEQKWYDFWIKENLFHSEPDEREPYTTGGKAKALQSIYSL